MAFLNFRSWFLQNLDTGQVFQSQFEPVGLTRDIVSNYAEHTALNRRNPILQFLNKATDTITFQATLFRQNVLQNSVEDDFALLESWVNPDEAFNNRPPILLFWVGDGHVQIQCILQSITGATFARPTFGGGVRRIDFTINLRQYEEFSLDESGIFETRYHRTKKRDYYELVAQREYGSPLKGDVIRKRNPDKPNMQSGDIVPFPDIVAIRKDIVEPKSIPLQTAYGKRLTPQKQNRLDMLDRRNRIYVSHTLVEH